MGQACSLHGEIMNAYSSLPGKPEEENHSEDPSVDGGAVLEQILGK
jgi:hypothetical protein